MDDYFVVTRKSKKGREVSKFLVYFFCEEDGYTDTSGHTHWIQPQQSRVQTYELLVEETIDDIKKEISKDIGYFLSDYPRGEVEIYQLADNQNEDLISEIEKSGFEEADRITKEKAQKEKLRKELIKQRRKEDQRVRDMAKFKELQEKYPEFVDNTE